MYTTIDLKEFISNYLKDMELSVKAINYEYKNNKYYSDCIHIHISFNEIDDILTLDDDIDYYVIDWNNSAIEDSYLFNTILMSEKIDDFLIGRNIPKQ